MAKDKCRFHPDLFSSGTCRQCGIPLCDACKILKTEGIFCSAECWGKFAKFQERISTHRSVRTISFIGLWWKRLLVLLLVIAALVILTRIYDINSPGDVPSAFYQMWSDLMRLF